MDSSKMEGLPGGGRAEADFAVYLWGGGRHGGWYVGQNAVARIPNFLPLEKNCAIMIFLEVPSVRLHYYITLLPVDWPPSSR